MGAMVFLLFPSKVTSKNLSPVSCFNENNFRWQSAEKRLQHHLGTIYAKWLALMQYRLILLDYKIYRWKFLDEFRESLPENCYRRKSAENRLPHHLGAIYAKWLALMQYRLIFWNTRFIVASFRMNFQGVFRKIFNVINRIYDFEFVINFTLLLHFAYNFSQRGFVKVVVDFFFEESLYTRYGHSFLLTYLIWLIAFRMCCSILVIWSLFFWKMRNFNDDCV